MAQTINDISCKASFYSPISSQRKTFEGSCKTLQQVLINNIKNQAFLENPPIRNLEIKAESPQGVYVHSVPFTSVERALVELKKILNRPDSPSL